MLLLPNTLLMTILVWTGTASTLIGREGEKNENDLDLEDKNDPFYPVADEDVALKVTLSPTSSVPTENFEEEQALIKAIKLLFRNYGHEPSDMKQIFLPNSSLFSADTTPKSTTTEKSNVRGHDEYSLSNFREKIHRIIEKNQGMKEDLRGLLRGFQRNQTLLIAMIQAAAQQWGDPHLVNLPPPFGDHNESLPLDISDDMRDELLDLSDLLTDDLKNRLVEILAVDQNKTKEEILDEMAIVEEDEDGNLNITVHGHTSSQMLKPKRETFTLPKTEKMESLNEYKESDDDDFTITEQLVVEDNENLENQEDEDDYRKPKSQLTEDEEEEGKISNAYLENIIRQEQKTKNNYNDDDWTAPKSAKRTKRIRRSTFALY